MTPRERLQRITKEANDAGHVASCSDNDAAALRELDLLLSEAVNLPFLHNDPTPASKCAACRFKERLAQSGYGEK